MQELENQVPNVAVHSQVFFIYFFPNSCFEAILQCKKSFVRMGLNILINLCRWSSGSYMISMIIYN